MGKQSRRGRKPRSIANEVQPTAGRKIDLAEEYHYVIADLTRIGIIAAILIGALVVMSFFL
jgi:hypothetical protein